MGKSFSGKKAAPFKKGGGRKTSHPNTAKGTPRKKNRGAIDIGSVLWLVLVVVAIIALCRYLGWV